MKITEGIEFGAADIEENFEQGAVTFARWFSRMMDRNGWSHPKLVQLALTATAGKSWVHSSQIASLRVGKLKSPGPRSFAALAYMFAEIDRYQKDTSDKRSPDLSQFDSIISSAIILRDNEGEPASIGFLFEVFCGWRMPPENAARRDYTDDQAAMVSRNAGKHIRRLMTADRLDLIDDMPRLLERFSIDKQDQEALKDVIIGQAVWKNDELDHQISCLSNMLKKVFKEDRKPEELMNDLLK